MIALGGSDGWCQLSSTERYDFTTHTWQELPRCAMSTRRWAAAACAHRHVLYVLGGSDGGTRLASVEKFNTRSGLWTTLSPLPSARYNFGYVWGARARKEGRCFILNSLLFARTLL